MAMQQFLLLNLSLIIIMIIHKHKNFGGDVVPQPLVPMPMSCSQQLSCCLSHSYDVEFVLCTTYNLYYLLCTTYKCIICTTVPTGYTYIFVLTYQLYSYITRLIIYIASYQLLASSPDYLRSNTYSKPESILLLILPVIIPSRIFQNFYPFFLICSHAITYCSYVIL